MKVGQMKAIIKDLNIKIKNQAENISKLNAKLEKMNYECGVGS